MRILPLCREKHQEAHVIGEDKFLKKYSLSPIKIDKTIEYLIKKGKIKIYEK